MFTGCKLLGVSAKNLVPLSIHWPPFVNTLATSLILHLVRIDILSLNL